MVSIKGRASLVKQLKRTKKRNRQDIYYQGPPQLVIQLVARPAR